MPPQTDKYFEKFLEEKFKGVSSAIDDLKAQQTKIETNVNNIIQTIEKIKDTEAMHFLDCPNTDSIKELKKNIDEFLFIKRYWKIFAIAASVMVLIGIVTVWEAKISLSGVIQTVNKTGKKVDKINADAEKKDTKELFNNENKD